MRDIWAGLLLVCTIASCSSPPAAVPAPAAGLAPAESAYADLRDLRDRYEVTTAAGLTTTANGMSLPELAKRHDEVRSAVSARLAAVDSAALAPDDARALGVMRATVAMALTPLGMT
ncbi:MAG: hypothetical protein ACREL3_12635, partial [Gemmatimonadales bacterium]